MKPAVHQLFPHPMPFEVSWLRKGRFVSVRSYSREVADQVFAEEQAKGNEPLMYLGGMLVAECCEEIAVS